MSALGEAPVTDKPYRLMWAEYKVINGREQLTHSIYHKPFATWPDAMDEGNRLLDSATFRDCEFTIIKIVSKTVVAGERAEK